jgi:hypothetical protein
MSSTGESGGGGCPACVIKTVLGSPGRVGFFVGVDCLRLELKNPIEFGETGPESLAIILSNSYKDPCEGGRLNGLLASMFKGFISAEECEAGLLLLDGGLLFPAWEAGEVPGMGREEGELPASCLESGDAFGAGLEFGENPEPCIELGENPAGGLDEVEAPEGGLENGDSSGSDLFDPMLSIDGFDVGDAVGGLLEG